MRSKSLIIAALIASAPVVSVQGQGYPFSQRASVSQTVAFTEFVVAYGRPVARGRTLFGELVPWERIWHPGADSATLVSVSRDVEVEGKLLAAGEYSLWLLPRERGNWTVIFSRAARVFHQPYPGSANDALRVDVAPELTAHMETMAIYFPLVVREEAVMRIHWGEVAVPIRIRAPWRPDTLGSASGLR
jgi:hypothetical protein